MRFKIFALVVLLTSILISCKDEKELEHISDSPGLNTNDSQKEAENEIPMVDPGALIQELQGYWRETEYPYRVAEFQDSLVKFIEEGIAEEPKFQEYKISGDCPFEVNNIINIVPEDLILVMIENKTCEKLKVSNDILTLSGFNVNTGTEYQIVYKRVD